jgi:hypothetical protein
MMNKQLKLLRAQPENTNTSVPLVKRNKFIWSSSKCAAINVN